MQYRHIICICILTYKRILASISDHYLLERKKVNVKKQKGSIK